MWGGLFWDLRNKLGQDRADKTLFDAWKSISDREDSLLAKTFVENIVERIQKEGNSDISLSVRKILLDRGLNQFDLSSAPDHTP